MYLDGLLGYHLLAKKYTLRLNLNVLKFKLDTSDS